MRKKIRLILPGGLDALSPFWGIDTCFKDTYICREISNHQKR